MIEKSQIIGKEASQIWDYISQLDNWLALIDDCEVTAKNNNTCTITKRVKAGFIKLHLKGSIALNVVEERAHLTLKTELNSKVVQTTSDIAIQLQAEDTHKTLMRSSAKINLYGTMADMAKPLAENIFVNILDNMYQKLLDD